MSVTSEIKLVLKQEGTKGLDDLSKKFNKVADSSRLANDKFQTITAELRKNEQQIVKSNKGLQDYSRAWRELANSLDRTSKEFKEATAEAAKFERQAAKASGRKIGGGAGALTAVASAGLLGPEALLGAGVGAMFGAPQLGAAIGSTVLSPMTSYASEAASYSAELQKQRLALQLVTKDADSYQEALKFIEKTSEDLAIPQDVITRQFTKLSASVIGAGGDINDAEKAFLGVASGIRGTGGSLQDLDSALTATSQVFSKGKVSAEELRQQIGERLPGAFTLFAESLNMTPAELDKALEQGAVSLQDFQTFAETLFKEFGASAETIAESPAAAGDRLQKTLSDLSDSVGQLLGPIGAEFQSTFAEIAGAINDAAKALINFFGLTKPQQMAKLTKDIGTTVERLTALDARRQVLIGRGADVSGIDNTIKTLKDRLNKMTDEYYTMQKIENAITTAQKEAAGLPSTQQKEEKSKKQSKQMKETSQELYELGLLRVEALEREDALNVALLDHQIRLQGIEEMNADANTKNLAVAESRQKFEQDIEKHIANQAKKQDEASDAAVKFNKLVVDTLLSTEKLTAEEEKRIKNNQDLVPIIEAGMLAIKLGTLSAEELAEAIRKIKAAFEGQNGKKSFLEDFTESFKDGVKDMGDLAGNLGSSLADAFKGAGDALTEFLTTGTTDFNEFARSVLTDLTNIFVQYAMFQSLKALFPGFGFADGGIMTKDGPMPLRKYAAGGIANSPQVAVYGEGSTPEAYVPLPDGRSIPVTMQNGGDMGNVVVNVDASGTSVQGDSSNANMLGEALGAAVQAELIRQKRPGGLLA